MSQFRHKLVLIFVLLVGVIIASMVIVVNNNISHISREKIETDLTDSQDILNTYFVEKNKSDSRAIQTMVLTQANIRAVLGTISSGDDDLFGEEESEMDDSKLLESSELISSTVEHLPLFQKSELFVILNESGQVVFTKYGDMKFGQNLRELKLVQYVFNGQEGHSFWSKKSHNEKIKNLFPQGEDQIF
ncbi:MAG: hypothetical protein MJK18_06015, partial [Bdellovibrionales bacterium]|nr:hypothetical protein [Bdellovibrionales bacterium]